jgi:hypothetical protein
MSSDSPSTSSLAQGILGGNPLASANTFANHSASKFSIGGWDPASGKLPNAPGTDTPINNPFPGVGGTVGAILNPLGGSLQHPLNNTLSNVLNLNQPQAAPNAPPAPPTLGNANLQTLGTQLSYEQKLAASNTILTGGGGLMDQPKTASETLMAY